MAAEAACKRVRASVADSGEIVALGHGGSSCTRCSWFGIATCKVMSSR